MGLRFIAIDPATDREHCPAVFFEEEAGDLLFQGEAVTDPETLAESVQHSPLGDNEGLVRLPARMRTIIKALSEAAGWHPAKTTRIEGAKQAPSEDDIRAWCRVCGAEHDVPDLIAASRAAGSMYIDLRLPPPPG